MSTETYCDANIVHRESVEKAASVMPGEETCAAIADFFKNLGDGTRIKILSALAATELCVCDLSALLKMSQSAVSHQLSLLKKARLVKCRREGTSAYYMLDDFHVEELFARGLEHVTERKHEYL